jgi:RhtB (resistance to homoserine/threonine) family protein
MVTEFATFAAVSAVVIMTPGPDTAMTIRNTLLGGRRTGVATALGIALGQSVWTVAASVGVAAVLVASEPAFRALQLAGAAYLIYIGLHSLWAAWRHPETAAQPAPAGPRQQWRKGLRQGLLSDLANPKMAVFFLSLLPQFVTPGDASFAGFLLLGVVFATMTFAWLTGYAFVVARAGEVLRRPRIRRALDTLTGTALVALGLRVAAESP